MYKYLLQGLLLGFAYVAPIGIQNLYVINTAVRENRKKALEVAFVTIFFDISLALAGFKPDPGFPSDTLLQSML